MTGYWGVTARIDALFPRTAAFRRTTVQQIVQAEIAPLVELLRKVEVELAEWAEPGELPGTLECGDCFAPIKDAANWFDHASPNCEAAALGKAVRAALDRVRTP
jgi:hypothetical protein